MQPVSPKRRIDRMLLWICPAMVIAAYGIGVLTQNDTDAVRIMAYHALVVELALLYLPARRFMEKHGGKRAFGLVRVSFAEIAWAVLLGAGAFFAATALNGATQLILRFLNTNMEQLMIALPQVQGWRLYALLLLMAVIPAVAEETMFRGALLNAWKPSGAKRALWHTALLFSLIHLQPNNLPALLFLGLLLGSVSLTTGSVYPAIVVHAVNNLIAVLLSNIAGAEAAASSLPEAAELLPSLAIYLGIGLIMGIPSYYALRFFAKHRREQQAAAAPQAAQEQPSAYIPEESGPGRVPFVFLTYALMLLLNAAIVASLFIQIPGL